MAGKSHDEEEKGAEPQTDEKRGGVFSELRDVAADAALTVLAPVAKRAATKTAQLAVKKAPGLIEDKLLPKLEEAGGPKGIVEGLMSGDGPAGELLSRLTGGDGDGDGGAADGTGAGRRMQVQQAVD